MYVIYDEKITGKGENTLSVGSSFESIYEKYSRKIYTYCYRMTASVHTAQELMQDTFVRLVEKYGDMTLQDNELSAFLYRIAHNLCVDHIRKEYRFSSVKMLLFKPDSPVNIEEHVVNDYYSEAMEKCLNALTPVQKSILILHIVEELPHGHIARILNKSEAAVRKQYQRSKSKIKKMLEKEGVVKGERISLV